MYTPRINEFTGKEEIVNFMRRFSFATIVTARDGRPQATHLPFLVEERQNGLTLTSHFARANTQWKEIETDQVLVIFTEPHAYISPSHYERVQNVPTWNYIAVHAYGEGKIMEDTAQVIRVLENTINQYESAYLDQWNGLGEDYKFGLMKGIVAFEITVTDLQAKKKLSQNKTENEKENIVRSLSGSKMTHEQWVAEYMREAQRGQNQQDGGPQT